MKSAALTAMAIIGIAAPLSFSWANVHVRVGKVHRAAQSELAPASLQSAREPTFKTVQPADDGKGILAPNGYRGPGSATGGPAGGLDDGGP